MGKATEMIAELKCIQLQVLPAKLAHSFFRGWGLSDLPLRASNEGLLRPRVA